MSRHETIQFAEKMILEGMIRQMDEAIDRRNAYEARPEVKAMRAAEQAAYEAAEKARKEKDEKARAIRRAVSAPRRRVWGA